MKNINNSSHYKFISRLYLKLIKLDKFKLGENNIKNFAMFLSVLRRIKFGIKNIFAIIIEKRCKKVKKRIKIFEKLLNKFLSFELLIRDFYKIRNFLSSNNSDFEDILLTIENSFYFQRINLLKNYDYLVIKKDLINIIWNIKNLEININKKKLKEIFVKFRNKFDNFCVILNLIKEDLNEKNITLFIKYFIQIRYLIEYFCNILNIKYTERNNFIKINKRVSKIKNINFIIEELTNIASETTNINVLTTITELKEYYVHKKKELIEALQKEIFDKKSIIRIEKIIDNIKEFL